MTACGHWAIMFRVRRGRGLQLWGAGCSGVITLFSALTSYRFRTVDLLAGKPFPKRHP
jgi:hypothetical protein